MALQHLPWSELHLLILEAGDVHEHEAGERLALAVAGAGVRVGALAAGAWPLESEVRGILRVQAPELGAVNSVDGLCVYTLYDGQVVTAGEVIARAKVIPFAVPAQALREGEAAAHLSAGVISVRPFIPMVVGAVVQESLGARAMARFEEALGEKVSWFGSRLLPPAFVAAEPAPLERGVRQLREAGAQVIVLAGSRSMDPLDPVFEVLFRLGGEMMRHGVPAHPGSLFWYATVGSVPLLGMPQCGLFSQATVFDLILPRLLTGERLNASELALLGHGGFLTRDMAFRFPPYRRTRERGAVD